MNHGISFPANAKILYFMQRQILSKFLVFFTLIFSVTAWGESVIPVITEVPSPKSNAEKAKSVLVVETGKKDIFATKFMTSCAGCHSLNGKVLTGPALNAASGWPEAQLTVAIKKMEPKAGPLPDDVVAGLVAFLKSPDAQTRLKAEEARMAAQFAAKMEPGDAVMGRDLFLGNKAFKNGGLSCVSCHAIEGAGGNLGPSLDGIFEKTGGEMPLISAIEQSKFKIMEPIYTRHPITKQEAAHLAKYFASLRTGAVLLDTLPLFAKVGVGAGVLLLIGMFGFLKFQRLNRGRDKQLQRRRK